MLAVYCLHGACFHTVSTNHVEMINEMLGPWQELGAREEVAFLLKYFPPISYLQMQTVKRGVPWS